MTVWPHESQTYSCPPSALVLHDSMWRMTARWRAVAGKRSRYDGPCSRKMSATVERPGALTVTAQLAAESVAASSGLFVETSLFVLTCV